MALAFDAASMGTASGGSVSWTHTCTGSNLILVVSFHTASSGTAGTITYGGNNLSFIRRDRIASITNINTEMWYLLNPPTGANTAVISISSSVSAVGGAVSLTGAAQSGQPDAQTGSATTTAGTSLSVSLTTVANNCLILDAYTDSSALGTATPGAGQTQNFSGTSTASLGASSRQGPISPAGAGTSSWTDTVSANRALSAISIAPFLSSSQTSSWQSLMGVGN